MKLNHNEYELDSLQAETYLKNQLGSLAASGNTDFYT